MSQRNNQLCRNCRFFEAFGGGDGECRRYAPKPYRRTAAEQAWVDSVGGPAETHEEVWPNARENEWCGEWGATA